MAVIVRGLRSSFVLAVFLHACLFVFTFVFSGSKAAAKPAFVFLGSFLRQQDLGLISLQESSVTPHRLDLRTFSLDSKSEPWPLKVQKPSLVEKTSVTDKSQFKPVVAEALAPSKSKKTDAVDLGIDLEPLPSVQMKIERND